MAIDLRREPPVSLRDVPRLPWLRGRGGKRLHVATVHRWVTRGVHGIRLEYLQRAGTRVTTEAALLRFFDRLTAAEAAITNPAARDESRDAWEEEELNAARI
jgi:hypothetical protein